MKKKNFKLIILNENHFNNREFKDWPIYINENGCYSPSNYFEYGFNTPNTFNCISEQYDKVRFCYSIISKKHLGEVDEALMKINSDVKMINHSSLCLKNLHIGDKIRSKIRSNFFVNALNKNNISIKEFLSNPRYFVITYGLDPNNTWERMKSNGIIDLKSIEKEIEF